MSQLFPDKTQVEKIHIHPVLVFYPLLLKFVKLNYIFQRSTGKIYYLDMAQSVYLSPAMISTIKSYFQLRLKGETAPAYDVFCKVGFDSEKMKQMGWIGWVVKLIIGF